MQILNMCTASLKMMTEIHDSVLIVLTKLICECHIDTSYISLDNLKPDLVIKYNNSFIFSTSQFPTIRSQTWNLPLKVSPPLMCWFFGLLVLGKQNSQDRN